ncbi:autotransporter outer membrane beta-barrel domain-containing protein [Xenorhabdus kozodoii]|uniref:Outer membrane esterase n=1 Tax=Xenorhabdus kozodoii TaxID=351676 RepID=A0A2D0LCN6_9GAMM|nr:autotransporter domain-containing protein [Xenorhabdus kozodoii]PHM73466.1 outer membrane esterase [Xenorhabdus kozodoii]
MKKAFLFTPALLALSISAISNAHAYSQVCVFGDSLSDGGNNGRYTTDGATSQLYDEYFSQYITGSVPRPSKEGGTNYAQGGATALEYKPGGANTQTQVDTYLKTHNRKAASNCIYIHWVGGNDLAKALRDGQVALKTTKDPDEGQKAALGTVNTSATAAANQINTLIDAGAGLVIAPTVPDVGTTPLLLDGLIRAGLEGKGVPENTIDGVLQEVHVKLNQHELPNVQARDIALKTVFHSLAQEGAKMIPGASAQQIEKELTEQYEKVSKDATALTNLYNQLVDEKISQKNGNILRADINGLLHEVIANPLMYGIQNTLGYSCALNVDADNEKCSIHDPGFTKDKKFLFADLLHPTPLGHEIMGQYITSIYIAPSQVMTLTQANRAPVKSALSSLDGHLQQLRNGSNEQGKVGIFGGYTGNQDKTFTLGSDYQLLDNVLLGAMYSRYKEERSPITDFSYSGNGHVLTAYTLWNYYNNGWLSGDIHYSRTNYDSLTRTIQLGQATRRETGSTTGKQWGARITAGWDIPVTHSLTTSPIIQYAWDKGEVDSYHESGNSSSSMNFGDQNYTSKVGTLGWRVDTQLGRFNPYASVQFNHQFGDTSHKLSGSIHSTNTEFVQESGKQNTNWRQYTVGVNANFLNNLRGFASVTRNDGNTQDPSYNFSLGINASF